MRRFIVNLGIALGNVRKHRGASSVLGAVFAMTALVVFWAFGFGNAVESLIRDSYRDSYGDIVFFTEYVASSRIEQILEPFSFPEIILEREIRGMYVAPQRSDMARVVEVTDQNRHAMKRWIKPIRGRIPEQVNELMVPELFLKGVFDVGDTVYIVISTPGKVLNTLRYRIVGVSKTIGIKGLPTGLLVTRESLDLLTAAKDQVNLVYVRLDRSQRQGDSPRRIYERLRSIFTEENIEVKSSWYLPKELERFTLYLTVLQGLKVIILVILFPLIGAVVAAIVWIYSIKRRHEIWTYVALGLRDRKVLAVFALEYWIIALLGIIGGVLLGFASSAVTYRSSIWLQFSYTFVSPLTAQFRLIDFLFLVVFLYACITLWLYPPLSRVIKTRPFSY